MNKKTDIEHCVSVHITLPPNLVEAIDQKAGSRGRSAFFREAAAAALRKPKLAKTLPQGRRVQDA